MGFQALTIEDSRIVRKILKERLKRAGWDVIEASNAREGWELFQSVRPQLVTLDIVMPNAEGPDALSLLARMRKLAPNTVIIVISGSSSIDDREKFMQAGAMAFISKPFIDFEKALSRIGILFPRLHERENSEVRDRTPISEDLSLIENRTPKLEKRGSINIIFIASIAAFALASLAYYCSFNSSLSGAILAALRGVRGL